MIRIFHNEDLTGRNSFHVHQKARQLIEFDAAEDLLGIFENHVNGEWRVVGGCNNILFTNDVEPTIIVPRNCNIDTLSEDEQSVEIRVGAGVEWDDLVEWAVSRSLWGIENLSLIPGKVGAAPVQNIGAYGCEAKEVITAVEMFATEQRKFVTLAAEHCNFGYRESVFKHALKGRVIITNVYMRLSKIAQPKLEYGDVIGEVESLGGITLRNIREAVCNIRRRKLPDTAVTGNAGSFFKNPIVEQEIADRLSEQFPTMPRYAAAEGRCKLAAGWLIDQAGLKGFIDENVGVHPKQALVLINATGCATGSEVIAFAEMVRQKVFEKFGITIECEVNIW